MYSEALFLYEYIFVCVLSYFSRVQLFVTLWTIAHQVLCPWDSPGKNTGVCSHALFQGIFLTQVLNLRLYVFCIDTCSLPLVPLGKPMYIYICLKSSHKNWLSAPVNFESLDSTNYRWKISPSKNSYGKFQKANLKLTGWQ